MSQNQPNNQEDQEIDLIEISKKIGGFFQEINAFLFRCIQFFVKNAIAILILLVIGVGLGFYLDKNLTSYDSEIIVMPNFSSNDYLYAKINLLNAKIADGDTMFLKSIGITEHTAINRIDVKPVMDVYKFANKNPQNFEMLKLMAEKGDVSKIVEDEMTSKNYLFHAVSIASSKTISENGLVKPLLIYLNSSEYYSKIKEENITNIKIKIRENDSIIKQIDEFLNSVKSNTRGTSSNLVYYNESSQLNDIIKTKDLLITEQGDHRLEFINLDKTIKEISIITNIKNTKSINGKLKLILPLLLVLLFLMGTFFTKYYKRQKVKFEIKA